MWWLLATCVFELLSFNYKLIGGGLRSLNGDIYNSSTQYSKRERPAFGWFALMMKTLPKPENLKFSWQSSYNKYKIKYKIKRWYFYEKKRLCSLFHFICKQTHQKSPMFYNHVEFNTDLSSCRKKNWTEIKSEFLCSKVKAKGGMKERKGKHIFYKQTFLLNEHKECVHAQASSV